MAGTRKSTSSAQNFVFGGLSCMTAATFTNPIDVIKIRLQIQGELAKLNSSSISKIYGSDLKYKGFTRGIIQIVKEEGLAGIYKGIVPSLLREASYSTIRMGGYDVMKELLGAQDPAHTPLSKKILAGAVSGAVGSGIANPTDLIKVRMQADSGNPRRYHGTIDAFTQLIKKEGFVGLYKGVGPTTYRATLLTATQLPAYDHSKHFLLNYQILKKDNLFTHFVASMIAGFMAAVVTSPVDVIKTRIMNQKIGSSGENLVYKGTLDCCVQTVKAEGLFGLYKGFFPNWIRIGPHTVITFIVFEKLRNLAGIRAI